LAHYPTEKVAQVDATMSQIKVLQKIIDVVTPIKSEIDHARETAERSGLSPSHLRSATPVGAK